MSTLGRREFTVLIGGVGLLLSAKARRALSQQPEIPVIGYLSGVSSNKFTHLLAAFRKGLGEGGFFEQRNVKIDFQYADGRYDRLPALATELVRRHVAVIVATQGTPTIRAAKAATSTIPIVFVVGSDPVMFGLVDSLNRPGGNVTGITLIGSETVAKRLELLLKLAPGATKIGVLANPSNPITKPQLIELHAAARALGRAVHELNATTDNDVESAFAAIGPNTIAALLVAADPFFDDRRTLLVALAARQRVPVSYVRREFVTAGGLMSYGPDDADAFRQAGIYTGRILKGEKPADLPVMRPAKFELAINLKTAKALGLNVPDELLALATEVIE